MRPAWFYLLFLAPACSSSNGTGNDGFGDFTTGGTVDQTSAGGSTASGGTQASVAGTTQTGALHGWRTGGIWLPI